MYDLIFTYFSRLRKENLEEDISKYEKAFAVHNNLNDFSNVNISRFYDFAEANNENSESMLTHTSFLYTDSNTLVYKSLNSDFYAPFGVTSEYLNYLIRKFAAISKDLSALNKKHFSEEKMNSKIEESEVKEYYKSMICSREKLNIILESFCIIGKNVAHFASNKGKGNHFEDWILNLKNRLSNSEKNWNDMQKPFATPSTDCRNSLRKNYLCLVFSISNLIFLISAIIDTPQKLDKYAVYNKDIHLFVPKCIAF